MLNAGGYGSYGGGESFIDTGLVFPDFQEQMEENFRQLQAQIQRQQQSIFEATNRIATDGANGIPGTHTAVSGIHLGPDGGYQAGAINPVAPGIESRFADELPPPSSNNYGVFSSSSSHTLVGPDGKTISRKSSTTGVNDNGKITYRTVQE